MLMVDDEPIIVNGLSRLLDYAELGFDEVLEATDSRIALDMLLSRKPDVMISDVSMPNLNGLDLLNRIREEKMDTRVIFLSGFPSFEYAQKAISLGAVAYLLKPVEASELKKAIEKARKGLEVDREGKGIRENLNRIVKREADHEGWAMEQEELRKKQWFSVLCVALQDDVTRSSMESNLVRFAAYNKVEALAKAHGVVATVKDTHSVVICPGENQADADRLADGIEEAVRDILPREYAVPVNVSRAGSVEGMDKIPEAHAVAAARLDAAGISVEREKSPIDQVKEYIGEHFAEDVRQEDLAGIACVGTAYFSSWFQRQTGIRFKDYLTQVRIETARDLLKTTDLKIYEVAEKVGFQDPRYFSEIFQKATGKKPQQVRKELS